MSPRLPLLASLAAAALLLAGCSSAAAPTPEPTVTDVVTESAAPAPTVTETAAPPAALTAGDCTADNDIPGPSSVEYTIVSSDDSSDIAVTYTEFQQDGSLPTTSTTLNGPIATIQGYACTDAAASATWTMTAESSSGEPTFSCILSFGGLVVKTDTASEGETSVDCSGNPGF